MTEQTFTYSKQGVFGGRFDSDRMLLQFAGSSLGSILARIDSDPDDVHVVFTRALEGSEPFQLAALIEAHDDLDVHKTLRCETLRVDCKTYIEAHYAPETQTSLLALLVEGQGAGLVNRVTYIGAALAWIKGCLTYYYATKDAMVTAATHEAVDAVAWDFAAAMDGSDPMVTLRQATEMID